MVGHAFGDIGASTGAVVLNSHGATNVTTSFHISNQFPVKDFVGVNFGAIGGGGNSPTDILVDDISSNTLTFAQQSGATLYVRDNSGTAAGVFAVVDPSTANSNVFQNGVDIFNGVFGIYSGSTTPAVQLSATGATLPALTLGNVSSGTQCLQANGSGVVAGVGSACAPLASPTFTGTPAAPTPGTADNSTKIATTAYVQAQGYLTAAPICPMWFTQPHASSTASFSV